MLKIRITLTSLFLFFLNIFLSGQDSGSITGTVRIASGLPAELVNVTLIGTSIGSITDKYGKYQILNIPAGSYTMKVSSIGFATIFKTVEVKKSDTTFISDIILIETTNELDEILVEEKAHNFRNAESEYVSRLPIKNIENPQSYSTSTKELFLQQNIVDYSSAVKTIPGVVVATQDGVGVLYVFTRGFITTPYIRNGIYILSPAGGDLQNTERIEIIRGPSGSVFGTAGVSYGGLINKVSKKPFGYKSINAGLTFGTYELQRFTADINLPLNEENTFLFRMNAAVHSEGSFQDYGYKKNYMLAPSFSYKINDKLNFLFEAELNIIDKSEQTYFLGAPGVTNISELKRDYFKSYGSPNLTQPPSISNNYYGRLNYIISKNWSLKGNIALGDFKLNGGNIFPLFVNDTLMIRRLYEYNAQYNTINIQPHIRGNFFIGGLENKFIAGFDYKYGRSSIATYLNTSADSINYVNGFVPLLNVSSARSNFNVLQFTDEINESYAFFISNALSITNQLNLLLSLRYEDYHHNGLKNIITGIESTPYTQGSFTPQAGITYQLIRNNISLFANYMSGANNVNANMEGQTFKPELAEQVEAGIKLDILEGAITSTISYYNISVKDKIRRDPANPILSLQDGTQLSKGADMDVRIAPLTGLNIIAGYAYNESKLTKANPELEGKRPLGTPKHVANVWASYSFNNWLDGFGIGAGLIYSDDYFYNDLNTLTIPSYTIFKAAIFYNTNSFRLNLSGENITDERYWDYLGTPQMPSKISVSINFHF